MVVRLIAVDLDGTLVRAKDIHYDALNLALQKIAGTSIDKDEHESTFNGLPTKTKLSLLIKQGRVKPKERFKVRKIEVYRCDNGRIEFKTAYGDRTIYR